MQIKQNRTVPLFLLWLLVSVLCLSLLPLFAFIRATVTQALAASQKEFVFWDYFKKLQYDSIVKSLRFTFIQSAASTALALVFGLPGAWMAARFNFKGRKALLSLSAVPFCFPPILVILAFILYYGKEGLLPRMLFFFTGIRTPYQGFLYSFWGLVIVHAFYNFPIAVHQISSHWMRIPDTQFEAARMLGAGKLHAFKTAILPLLFPGVIQAAGIIFLYCFFSFTTVLVFGARIGATLEVEIYQALRYQYDLLHASAYSIIESLFAIAGIFFLTKSYGAKKRTALDFGKSPRLRAPRGIERLIVLIYGIFILLFFIGPLFAIMLEAFKVPSSFSAGEFSYGFGNFQRLLVGFQAPLKDAIFNTLRLSGMAAFFATLLGLIVSGSLYFLQKIYRSVFLLRATDLIQWLPMAISPAILAHGWLFLKVDRAMEIALVAAQTAIAWPYVSRVVYASLKTLDPRKMEAARTLGASPLRSFISIELRTVFPSLAAAAAFAFSITAGDANIPLMLGAGEIETLPLLLFRLTSAYRFNEACAAALVLGALTGFVFFIKEKTIDVA